MKTKLPKSVIELIKIVILSVGVTLFAFNYDAKSSGVPMNRFFSERIYYSLLDSISHPQKLLLEDVGIVSHVIEYVDEADRLSRQMCPDCTLYGTSSDSMENIKLTIKTVLVAAGGGLLTCGKYFLLFGFGYTLVNTLLYLYASIGDEKKRPRLSKRIMRIAAMNREGGQGFGTLWEMVQAFGAILLALGIGAVQAFVAMIVGLIGVIMGGGLTVLVIGGLLLGLCIVGSSLLRALVVPFAIVGKYVFSWWMAGSIVSYLGMKTAPFEKVSRFQMILAALYATVGRLAVDFLFTWDSPIIPLKDTVPQNFLYCAAYYVPLVLIMYCCAKRSLKDSDYADGGAGVLSAAYENTPDNSPEYDFSRFGQ